MHPVRAAPAEVELEVVASALEARAAHDEVRPDRPRDPAADPVEVGRAVDREQQRLGERLPRPAEERVAGHHLPSVVVRRQHPPAQRGPDDPDAVPDEPETAEVGARVHLPPELARIRPRADRVQVRGEGEEDHRPHRVAHVREGVCPLADQEAVGDHRLAPDPVDEHRHQDAEEQRVREADAGPAAVEPGRVFSP